MYGSVKGQ